MTHPTHIAFLFVLAGLSIPANAQTPSLPAAPAPGDTFRASNPAIDMPGFLRVSQEAARQRQSHRLSEAGFLRLLHKPKTLILDARSREKYDELHIKGAVNLSFPDITVASLHQLIPDKNTLVLIYCNNNFQNAEGPFPSKLPGASLNLSTYISLYTYGYRNVYELGPLLDIKQSHLPFEGASLTATVSARAGK